MIGRSGSMIGSGGALPNHASRGGKIRPNAVLVCVALIGVLPSHSSDGGITARSWRGLKPRGCDRRRDRGPVWAACMVGLWSSTTPMIWTAGSVRTGVIRLWFLYRNDTLDDWKPHDEPSAQDTAGGGAAVFGGDLAVQGLDDLPADRQTKAGMLAEALAFRAFGVEAVED